MSQFALLCLFICFLLGKNLETLFFIVNLKNFHLPLRWEGGGGNLLLVYEIFENDKRDRRII